MYICFMSLIMVITDNVLVGVGYKDASAISI